MNKSMSKIRWVTGTVLLGSALTFAAIGISGNAAEGWEKREFGEHKKSEHRGTKKLAFTPDNIYQEECGACHLAYPPHLLPPQSWRTMMNGLADHFGENAELDDARATHITQYLEQQATQPGKNGKAGRMLRNLPEQPPLRITELPYFVHEHDEIPKRLVRDNPKVNSLSQCDSCHSDAARGWFDEDRVTIPGYGRWDD
mgnify:CR=1 FL=1